MVRAQGTVSAQGAAKCTLETPALDTAALRRTFCGEENGP